MWLIIARATHVRWGIEFTKNATRMQIRTNRSSTKIMQNRPVCVNDTNKSTLKSFDMINEISAILEVSRVLQQHGLLILFLLLSWNVSSVTWYTYGRPIPQPTAFTGQSWNSTECVTRIANHGHWFVVVRSLVRRNHGVGNVGCVTRWSEHGLVVCLTRRYIMYTTQTLRIVCNTSNQVVCFTYTMFMHQHAIWRFHQRHIVQ